MRNRYTACDELARVASEGAARLATDGGEAMSGKGVDTRGASEQESETLSLLSDPKFIESLRRQMLKFATLQLSDSSLAEDAVQEALLGALKNASSYSRRSALKSWVFAILKHKIADILRQRQRFTDAGSLMREREEEEDLSELFDGDGFWKAEERPVAWGNPEAFVRERQFWLVFETCLDHLPGNQARVFMMREFVELDTPEICATVGITVSNLNVMLYRARIRLRECLENRWFAEVERRC